MKRRTECLCFLLALVVLTALQIGCFAGRWNGSNMPEFTGKWHYLRLLLSDALFLTALRNTILLRLTLCLGVALVLCVVLWLLRKRLPLSRGKQYAIIGCVSALAVLLYGQLTGPVYNMAIDGLLSLQISVVTTLLVWIAEQIMRAVSRRRDRT